MSSSISGNAGRPGAKVWWATDNPSFTPNGSVTADGAGNYTIPGLADASYIVNPSLAGFTFSALQIITISGSNVTGVNFSATPVVPQDFTQLAAESFTEADINPLDPAKWTVWSGFLALQILSNRCQSTGTPGVDESAENYTGVSFTASQYAECKVAALTGDARSELALQVLTDVNGAGDGISISNNGDGTATFSIYDAVGDSLFVAAALPFSIGDVFRIVAVGPQIIAYRNGVQIAASVDPSAPASGSPAIFMSPLASLADVQVTNFAAGNAAASGAPKGTTLMTAPILLQPGQNGYFFGSYDDSKPNPRFAITRTAGDGATATLTVKQLEGFKPAVGDLITVTGTTQGVGAFNVSNAALTAVSLDPVTGIGTLQYASTTSAASAPDFGSAVVVNPEVPEVLANVTSRVVALQTIAGENANGKTIAWASTFPTAPIAVTLSLQGALFDNDGDYQTIASTNNIAGDNLIIVDILQRFFRVVASGVSGGATVISKITV